MNQRLHSLYALTMGMFAAMMMNGSTSGYRSYVASIKAKGRDQTDRDYRDLIKDLKAPRKTRTEKSESQKRFMFNNLANMEKKRTLKFVREI